MKFFILVALAAPQDLWGKAREIVEPGFEKEFSWREKRLDLSLNPVIDPHGDAIKPGTVGIEIKAGPKFSWDNLDIQASFRAEFSKEARKELVAALVNQAKSELTGSSLVLVCQMSPTLCDAIKHYKLMARLGLQEHLERARWLDRVGLSPAEHMRAAAIKRCVADEQAKKVPLDDALKACQKRFEFPGVKGDPVREFDLAQEVGKALNLPSQALQRVQELTGGLKFDASGVRGNLKVRPVADVYARARRAFEESWGKALEEWQAGSLSPQTLRALAPPGAPPVAPAEVQRLALMPEADRRVGVSVLAAAMALQETADRVAEVQAALESAELMAPDEAVRETLKLEARRLESELRRLTDQFELAQRAARARLSVDRAARAAAAEALAAVAEVWNQNALNQAVKEATVPWGEGCPRDPRSRGEKR